MDLNLAAHALRLLADALEASPAQPEVQTSFPQAEAQPPSSEGEPGSSPSEDTAPFDEGEETAKPLGKVKLEDLQKMAKDLIAKGGRADLVQILADLKVPSVSKAPESKWPKLDKKLKDALGSE